MTTRTLVVDDEPPARRRIRQLLEPFPQFEVVDEAASLAAAERAYIRTAPDLVFLDIQLGKRNAFELFEKVNVTAAVIFTTAYDRFAVRAFEVNALDYLLKPIDPSRFEAALRRVTAPVISPEAALQETDTVAVRSRRGLRFVPLSTVTRIEARGDYTEVFTIGRAAHLSEIRMTEWMSRLSESFVRVHRSHIVRRSRIASLEKRANGWAVRVDNTVIPVGRRYYAELRRRLE
ncbi:MAG: LytTR family DNA-binding domain-containing protein [Myxococcota bacterium]